MASYPDEYDLTEAELEGMTPVASDNETSELSLSDADLEGMAPLSDLDLEGMVPFEEETTLLEDAADIAKVGGAGITNALLSMGESIWRTPDMLKRGYGALHSMITGTELPDEYNPISYISEGFSIGDYKIEGTTGLAERIGTSVQTLPEMSQTFADVAEAGINADKAFNEALGGEFTRLGQVVKDPKAWSGFIGQAVPSLFAAWKSGGSMTFMAWLEGMEQAGSAAEFEKVTGQKIDDETYTASVLATGMVNGALEKMGLESILKGKGSLTRQFFGGMTGEAATEGAQSFSGNLISRLYDKDASLTEGILPGMMGGAGTGGPAGFMSGVVNKMAPPKDALDEISDKILGDIEVEKETLGLPASTIIVTPEGVAATEANIQAAEELGLRGEGFVEPGLSGEIGLPVEGTIDFEAPDMEGIGEPIRGTRAGGQFQDWQGGIPFEEDLSVEDKENLAELRGYMDIVTEKGDIAGQQKIQSEIDVFLKDKFTALQLQDPDKYQPIRGKDRSVKYTPKDLAMDLSKEPAVFPEEALPATELPSIPNEEYSAVAIQKTIKKLRKEKRESDQGAPKNVLHDIASRGQIDWDMAVAEGFDPADMIAANKKGMPFGKPLFKKGSGNGFDSVAEKFSELGVAGFGVGETYQDTAYSADDAINLVGEMISGKREPVYMPGTETAELERQQKGEALDSTIYVYENLLEEVGQYEAILENEGQEAADEFYYQQRAMEGYEQEVGGEFWIEGDEATVDTNFDQAGETVANLLDQAAAVDPEFAAQEFERLVDASDAQIARAMHNIIKGDKDGQAVETTKYEEEQRQKQGDIEAEPVEEEQGRRLEQREVDVEQRQAERRIEPVKRKRVSEMTEAEKDVALLTSKKSGLRNERAYEEDEQLAHQSFFDIDNFKQINDVYTYDGADKILKAFGDIMLDAANENVIPYHLHGDEFIVQSNSPMALKAFSEKVQKALNDADVTIEFPNGEVKIATNIGASYGIAKTKEQAESNLKKDKAARAEAGLRTERERDTGGLPEQTAREGQDTEGRVKAEQDLDLALDELGDLLPSGEAAVAPSEISPPGGKSADEISAAAAEAEGHTASQAQIDAGPNGNFKKGHLFNMQGFKLSIENEAGTKRNKMTPAAWPVLAHHYGDVTGTIGADGDPIDVFIKKGADIAADHPIYVINQNNKDGSFDEHKVMMGFDSAEDAKQGYLDSYSDDFTGFDNIVETTSEQLKSWINDGDMTAAYAEEFELAGQTEAEIQADEQAVAEAKKKEVELEKKAEVDEGVDEFALTGSEREADEAAARGQEDIFAEPAAEKPVEESIEYRKAKMDLDSAMSELGDILLDKNTLKVMPVDSGKVLPVLTRLFDAAFRMGYYKFKDAAKFALDTIRSKFGDEAADAIDLKLLQGAYIAMSSGQEGAEGFAEIGAVTSVDEINQYEAIQDETVTTERMERDRPAIRDEAPVDEGAVPVVTGEPGPDVGRAERPFGESGIREQGDIGLPDSEPVAVREPSYPDLFEESGEFTLEPSLAADRDTGRGRDALPEGVSPDRETESELTEAAAEDYAELNNKLKTQKAANSVEVNYGDIDNIRETLPLLHAEQQEDVEFIEDRLANERGVLITNGTGTGKTFSGIGTVRRYASMGKDNIIIAVPSQKIAKDWIATGELFGLDITALESIKDAGKGIVITTYANFGQNPELAEREWDLVVPDEAHRLTEGKDAKPTKQLQTLRALTGHPRGHHRYASMKESELIGEIHADEKKIADLNAKHGKKMPQTALAKVNTLEKRISANRKIFTERKVAHDANRIAHWNAQNSKTLMLSASPFAYEKSLDLAEGYLFEYGPEPEGGGYNAPNARESFFVEHLGYRMRFNKLTTPEAEVDSGLMQRELNQWLKEQGALRGRRLLVDHDYSREFIAVDDMIGNKIDEGIEWVHDQSRDEDNPLRDGYSALAGMIEDQFDYHSRMKLLEAIKAKAAVPRIQNHLDMGRQVVIFHSRIKGGGVHPFHFEAPAVPSEREWKATVAEEGELYKEFVEGRQLLADAIADFDKNRNDLVGLDLDSLIRPIDLVGEEYADNVVFFNGAVSEKNREKGSKSFNKDTGEAKIIMLQDDAGREGISLHDTTGKHQRVLINLGLPVKPTQTIQIEGRTYRVGQMSDAIFEYFNTGTNFERYAFASKIAGRSGTAENLAMGSEARNFEESFIEAFEEPNSMDPHAAQGKGGKEADKGLEGLVSAFDKAKSYYYGTLKTSGKRDQRAGADYFATAEPIGLKMVEWSHALAGEAMLEPSSGHGAIARFFPKDTVNAFIEPSGDLASRTALRVTGDVKQIRFEDLNITNKYDVIVMNPPYGAGGATSTAHLEKAMNHLNDGGRIVALLPEGPAADKKLEKLLYGKTDNELATMKNKLKLKTVKQGDYDRRKAQLTEFVKVADISLPGVAFKRAGTSVRTHIVILERHTNMEYAPEQQSKRDIQADTVNELFDRIEDMAVPKRGEIPAEQPAKAEPVAWDRDTVLGTQTAPGMVRDETLGEADIVPTTQPVAAPGMSIIEGTRPGYTQIEFAGKPSAEIRTKLKAAGYRWSPKNSVWYGKTDKLLDLGGDKGILFSKSSFTTNKQEAIKGITEAQAEEALKIFLKEMGKPSGVKIFIAPTKKSAMTDEVYSKFKKDQVRGFYKSGTEEIGGGRIVLILEDIESVEKAVNVLRHEWVAHHGLNTFNPADKKKIINRIRSSKGEMSLKAAWAHVEGNYPNASPDIQAEELLAYMAENKATRLSKLWNDLVLMIQNALKKMGLIGKGKITKAEVVRFVEDLASRVGAGAAQQTYEGEVAYSKERVKGSPEQEAAMADTIAVKDNDKPWRARINGFFDRIRAIDAAELRQGFIDEYNAISEYEKDQFGEVQDASLSAFKATKRTKNLDSVMAAILMAGPIEYRDGAFQLKKDGKGFTEIFDELSKKGLIPLWEAWAGANRANRLIRENKEQNFTQEQIDVLLMLEHEHLGENGENLFRNALEEYQSFNKQILDMAESVGVIDPEARALWESNDYVPFYRAMEEIAEGGAEVMGPKGKGGIQGQRSGIKKLIGGEEKVNSIIENMVLNTAHMVDASFKNVAMQRVVELTEDVAMEPVDPAFQPVGIDAGQMVRALRKIGVLPDRGTAIEMEMETGVPVGFMTSEEQKTYLNLFRRVAPAGNDIVSVMVDGNAKYYRVNDRLLLRSITNMGVKNLGEMMKVLRGAKRVLTTMVTIDPGFMIANFMRDTLSTSVVSHAGLTPGLDAVTGFANALKEDPALLAIMAAGGGGGGYYHATPAETQANLHHHLNEIRDKDFKETILDSPKKLWNAWQKVGAASENANRIAIFKKIKEAGGTTAEAVHQAQDILNFTQTGDFATMRFLIETVPFMNARVQGLDRLYRGAREDPKAFMVKGMMLAAASMAMLAANWDDEEYDELPEWDKDTYWHFFLGEKDKNGRSEYHFRLPKPFEVGAIFATIPERIARAVAGKDDSKTSAEAAGRMVGDTFAMNPIPQLFKPMAEQYMDKLFFTGSPIVGRALENVAPEAQYSAWTSETMRALAEGMPDNSPEWLRSPKRLEAALRGYTGTMGSYVLAAADVITREAGDYPDAPTTSVSRYPVLGRFMRGSPTSTKFTNEFYDAVDKANEAYSTIKKYREEGELGKADVLRRESMDILGARKVLNRYARKISEINNKIKRLQSNRMMTDEKKRDEIDRLTQIKLDLQKKGALLK